MQLSHINSISILCCIFLLQSCASLTGFQDGKTVGEGNGEISVSGSFSRSPNLFEEEDEELEFDDFLSFPNFEASGRYGVHDKIDIVMKVNTLSNLVLGVKGQIIGDSESKVALAGGLEIGTFGFILPLWNIQFPISLSVHPSDRFTWYISPKFTYQFSSPFEDYAILYAGGNTGIMVGEKHKFMFEFGYYNIGLTDLYQETNKGTFTVGLGGKFMFKK